MTILGLLQKFWAGISFDKEYTGQRRMERWLCQDYPVDILLEHPTVAVASSTRRMKTAHR